MPRYSVQRSTQIDASPERVFDVVSDFGTWTTWSPWLCADPNAHVEVSDDSSSVGSLYSWAGELVGEGEIEHRKLQSGRLIEDEIRFMKPFRSKSEVAFNMEPAAEGTKITWHMRGNLPWFLFWMRSQMEGFIGMDYDRGLRMLKELMETGSILSKTNVRGVESVGPLRMAGIRKSTRMNDIGSSMCEALSEAKQKFDEASLPTDGETISVYHDLDMKNLMFDYTSGFIVGDSAATIPDSLSSWSLPPGTKALAVEHTGSYANLGNAWSAANQYARYKKLKQSRVGAFELYKNDPETTAAADLRTEIYLPLK